MSNRAIVLVLAGLAVAAPLEAQRSARQMDRGHRGAGIERVLKLEQTLELTEDQKAALVDLKAQHEAFAKAHRQGMMAIRDQIRSGDLSRNEIQELTEKQAESRRLAQQAHRESIEAILDEGQRAKLAEIGALQADRVREGMRRARSGRNGAGMRARGGRGGQPGFRGGRGGGQNRAPFRGRRGRGGR